MFPFLADALGRDALTTSMTGGAYSADVRWLVVWQRVFLGCGHGETTLHLAGIHKDTQQEIIDRFWVTGGVETWQGRREAPPHNLVVGSAEVLVLLGQVAGLLLCAMRKALR